MFKLKINSFEFKENVYPQITFVFVLLTISIQVNQCLSKINLCVLFTMISCLNNSILILGIINSSSTLWLTFALTLLIMCYKRIDLFIQINRIIKINNDLMEHNDEMVIQHLHVIHHLCHCHIINMDDTEDDVLPRTTSANIAENALWNVH